MAAIVGTINQSILDNGHYLLNERIVYYSPRYMKTITVSKGRDSDGATGAFDVVSCGWWVHDELCKKGCWDDGTKLSNWQCSQVLQDILESEGRRLQGLYWFWFTLALGGGEARKNGMFRVASTLLLIVTLSGCSTLEATSDILDILYDDPEAVCDSESVGLQWKGETCLKYSDGTYRWSATK